MKLQDLIDARENWAAAEEAYYELLAAKKGEEAQFGDSWPGSEQDLKEAADRIAYWRKETDRIADMPLEV
jgi:hypothetical protein